MNESNLQQQCTQLNQFSKHYQSKVEEQSKTIFDLEMKLAVISSQLSSLQLSHDKAIDTVRILRDEKQFIIQEKAQLEGQLQQVNVILKKHMGEKVI